MRSDGVQIEPAGGTAGKSFSGSNTSQPSSHADSVARALVLIGLAGEFVEEADLAKHRPDSAHLPHHPLDRFVAGVRIGRDKLSRLVGKLEEDSNSASGVPLGPSGP